MFSKTATCCFVMLLRSLIVNSHGNGAPSSVCDTMLPGHWVTPQEAISPFQVIIDKTVIVPGDRVNITLRTIRGQPGFKGFLVMVKDGGEEAFETPENTEPNASKPDNQVYGGFDISFSEKYAQPVHCFKQRNSAMTHISNDVKEVVELSWIAPKLVTESTKKQQSHPYMERELRVVATFVKDFWAVWTDVEPVHGARLLLTDMHQISPKFQATTAQISHQEFQREPILINVPAPEGNTPDIDALSKSGQTSNQPLDENSSWTHFKRAWNYVVDLFNSATTASSYVVS